MLSMHSVLLYLFLGLAGQTLAHSHLETEHEIEVQRALQAAAYHVSLFVIYRTGFHVLLTDVCVLVRTSYRVIYCVAKASLGTTGARRFSCYWHSSHSCTPAPILN